MRLLIVDDSLVVRNAIQRAVDEGKIAEVFRAEDGEEAVSLFARERPELVTMDLTLPRLDGLGAIARIRAIEPRTSILVISALNSHKTAMEAIYVPDLPQFVTAILATDLPENAVIAFGNKKRTFLDVAAHRSGTSLLPTVTGHDHAHHHGLAALHDVSPSLVIKSLNGAWDDRAKAWLVKGDSVRLSVRLEGQTAPFVARQPGKLIVFVDYVQTFERTVRTPEETIDLSLDAKSGAPHTVSINWQSEYGPLAPNSIRVAHLPGGTSSAGERPEVRNGQR